MPNPRSLSVWLDSYRRDLKGSISAAAGHGFASIQPNIATNRELSAAEFTRSARRHFARYIRDMGVSVDALAAAFPGAGIADPANAEIRLAELRRTLEAAREIGIPRAIVTIGGFADQKQDGFASEMVTAAGDLAEATGVEIALLPTDSGIEALVESVHRTDCPSLRLAIDSAGLSPTSPDQGYRLASCLHLRDGRRTGSEIEEVDFGQGQVDFRAILARFSGVDRAPPSLVIRQDRAGSVDAVRAGREYIGSLFSAGAR